MNKKYFYSNNGMSNQISVYPTQIKFLKQLEKIISDKLMEKLYFNADLKGLINELIKYGNTESEVLEFIVNTDYMHKNQYTLSPIKKRILNKAIIKVNSFLVKSYYNSLLSKKIKYKSILKELVTFMNDLVDIKVGFKSNYNYMDNVNKYYEDIKEKKLKL